MTELAYRPGRCDKMGTERCGQRCRRDQRHSPGFLENRMLKYFSLSLRFGIKVVWRINKRNFQEVNSESHENH